MPRYLRTLPLATLVAAALVVVPAPAGASSGTMVITSDTTLTENHQGTIVVAAVGVTLDCAGHSVSGPGDPAFGSGGILVTDVSSVTVTGCRTTGFLQGIEVARSEDVLVVGNMSVGNPGNGIYLNDSAGVRVVGNKIARNGAHGVHLDSSSGNALLRNTIRRNHASELGAGDGVVLTEGSNGNTIRGNSVRRNEGPGVQALGVDRGLVAGNLVEENMIGILLEGSAGMVIRENRVLENDPYWGILLSNSSDNIIKRNLAQENSFEGITLVESVRNVISENIARANLAEGISVYINSNHNTVVENVAVRNSNSGIGVFDGSSFNRLSRNVACNNASNLGADGFDDETGSGNVWLNNVFCTSEI